ncbi:MAG: hypothetical protein A3H97_07965 [Acidobacteria bacterium RIFCSPLOWO2_02_FULL_65_29]|nr:MAG: hypothetical protein A3H97_07965 [Acidobacteria bacterium RIFCSPLOWO2_02_FULL_65_29]
MTKGLALSLTVVIACALADFRGSAAETPDATSGVRLKAISSRVNAQGASLVIEATEPVPYVSTRPDPLTVALDFRNVGTDGLANSITPNAASPITSVAVEPSEMLGVRIARVKVGLARPVGYHVRSERNTVVVEFDNILEPTEPSARPASRATPDALQALKAAAVAPDALSALRGSPADVTAGTVSRATSASQLLSQQTPGSPRTAAAPQSAQSTLSAAPSVQAAAAGQIGSTATGQERRYQGHPVSMQFEGLDLRAVLRLFAEISGLNMVIDPTVQGSVDVALTEVPWDQALDIILRANKLGYVVDGTIVRIAPITVLSDEEAQRRKLADERALSGDLQVLTRTLSYAKAADLVQLITRSALSARGTVQVDPRTNTLIITDLQAPITKADDLLRTLDTPQPQVEIEARIVQTNRNYARALGIRWGFTGRAEAALGNTTNLAFPNSGVLQGAAAPGGTAINLPVPGAPSAVGLALGSVNGAFNLDIALSALENSGNLRILSSPRVSTLNNVAAEMTQGLQIPYQTSSNNTTITAFKDAALKLIVTPQITAAGTVILNVNLENSSADFAGIRKGIDPPPINTQRAITTLLVSDGDTTVIGGIYTNSQQNRSDRTPGLSQIPILSWLFKSESTGDASTELLIFITPRIIKA